MKLNKLKKAKAERASCSAKHLVCLLRPKQGFLTPVDASSVSFHIFGNSCFKERGKFCKMIFGVTFCQRSSCIALWVKSGNRGNLKCLKVNNNFALIFCQKFFIPFLSDAKLPKVYD